jgi:DNA-binding PadR family transcriptional regulator
MGFDVLLHCVDDGLIDDVTPDEMGLVSRYYRLSEKGRDYVSMR